MLRDKFVNSILKERQPSLVAYSTTCSEADFAATKLSPKTKSTKLSCIFDLSYCYLLISKTNKQKIVDLIVI